MNRKLHALARAAQNLADLGIAECAYEGDLCIETNHWSATLDVVKEQLGRRLTDEELTVLSLSRSFGPTPFLTDAETVAITAALWPEGNGAGNRYSWCDLSAVLDVHAGLETA